MRFVLAATGLALSGLVAPLAGQSPADAAQPVVAGEEYRAGSTWRTLGGDDYRDLWTTPVTLPVLDLQGFAGGLEVVEAGGGMQTRSLRFQGGDGREYNFRSANKFIGPGLPEDLRETLVERFLQDQVSSLHPAAAIIATRLLEAAGIPNPNPQLVILPDSPLLGEFRAEFAGMVGSIEVHPNETEDERPDFAGAAEVDGVEDVLDDVDAGPADRFNAEEYLRERLVSLILGDWDRHAGQYRWARRDSANVQTWEPIPEDRDYALANYDGWLLRFAGPFFPQAQTFGEALTADIPALTQSSAPLDRRILGGLSWSDWEPVVAQVSAALTDPTIREAVGRAPEEWRAIQPDLATILIARRDQLPAAARRFYDQLTRQADLHGTDAAETVRIERRADGGLRVTMESTADEWAGDVLLDRTFLPGETDEIRLHLAGGDDRAEVTGVTASDPTIRLIGGEGDDMLIDRTLGAGVWFHDSDAGTALTAGPDTRVDRVAYQAPEWIPGESRPPPDWGGDLTWFAPWIGWEGTQGVILGGGPVITNRGFRRLPFADRLSIRGMFAPRSGDVAVDATLEIRGIGARPDARVHARLSNLEAFRFHGFGNQSPDLEDPVHQLSQARFSLALDAIRKPGIDLEMGPVVERITADDRPAPDSPAAAPEPFGKLGMAARFAATSTPDRAWFERGWGVTVEANLFADAWDVPEPFGRLEAAAAGYLPLVGRSVIAVRGGGALLRGSAPFFEYPTLGGSRTVRGFEYQRYVGDGTLHGSTEVRVELLPVKLGVRGRLGALAFIDAGRVYHDGDSPGGWQIGRGAGLWFETLGTVASATWARGDGHRVYLTLGMPF